MTPGPAHPSVGVYVHVPFCERVCPYCDFPVVKAWPLGEQFALWEARYVEALLAELERRRGDFAGRALASLYLGGGTPALLQPASVARLVGAVRSAFPVPDGSGDVEVTLEANPSTLERSRLPAFREAGVSRLSLGVQSFDDGVLKRLGRAHRADEARHALRAARAAGFGNVSLDLMVAVPGQRPEDLERDLAEALGFDPEHLSAYALTVEAGTPFALARSRGQLALPDDDAAAALLERLDERLEAAGLSRYELSSWARPGRESVHNRRYWQRRPVLGIGMGAWSSEPASPAAPHGARRANPRGLEDWLEAAEGEREVLDPATARGEAVFLALRTGAGLSARRFAAEFGAPPRGFFDRAIGELVGAGLLSESDTGDLRLTGRGLLLADTVSARFV